MSFEIVLTILVIINILLVLMMIFLERKKPQTVLSWALLMVLLPGVGFIIYVILGNGLSVKTRIMLKRQNVRWKELRFLLNDQKQILNANDLKINTIANEYKQLVVFNIDSCSSVYTENNDITLFTNGKTKLESLIKDIKCAKSSINLCYYIFASDETGSTVCEVLKQKAKEGVTVNLLIDAVGSKRFSRKTMKELKACGVNVVEFFPPVKIFRLVNARINYRNHRKIAVIDGVIGYIGGINIRNDHMENGKKKLLWRDDHLRIVGDSVFELQRVFMKDWRYSYDPARKSDYNLDKYFQVNDSVTNNCGIQIVHSGPDDDREQIKMAMIKMISQAKNRICLQTPYFIPDDSFFDALRMAALSGVEVNIMLPKNYDQFIPFYASLSYAENLISYGVNIYLREGFLHAKSLVIDDSLAMVGSCNSDIRSFSLNFEASAIVFDAAFGKKMASVFSEDVKRSQKLTHQYFKNAPWYLKGAKSICRLFSGVL